MGSTPAGWDTFNDSRLAGYWGLVQYSSDPVGASDANYLYFNGNGRGYYYYLQGGREYTERTVYYSQDSNTGTSNYQINIQYEYSSPVTMNYWFTHGGNTNVDAMAHRKRSCSDLCLRQDGSVLRGEAGNVSC